MPTVEFREVTSSIRPVSVQLYKHVLLGRRNVVHQTLVQGDVDCIANPRIEVRHDRRRCASPIARIISRPIAPVRADVDGTNDGAATAIVAVKCFAFGAPCVSAGT
jgi:hypothetical protein